MKRTILRSSVTAATLLPIMVMIFLMVLFDFGLLGRCDGIGYLVWAFRLSPVLLAIAMAGTIRMAVVRLGEPWPLLITALVVQTSGIIFCLYRLTLG